MTVDKFGRPLGRIGDTHVHKRLRTDDSSLVDSKINLNVLEKQLIELRQAVEINKNKLEKETISDGALVKIDKDIVQINEQLKVNRKDLEKRVTESNELLAKLQNQLTVTKTDFEKLVKENSDALLKIQDKLLKQAGKDKETSNGVNEKLKLLKQADEQTKSKLEKDVKEIWNKLKLLERTNEQIVNLQGELNLLKEQIVDKISFELQINSLSITLGRLEIELQTLKVETEKNVASVTKALKIDLTDINNKLGLLETADTNNKGVVEKQISEFTKRFTQADENIRKTLEKKCQGHM
jgi:formiminotetrahydrofolate cyclodeaminase